MCYPFKLPLLFITDHTCIFQLKRFYINYTHKHIKHMCAYACQISLYLLPLRSKLENRLGPSQQKIVYYVLKKTSAGLHNSQRNEPAFQKRRCKYPPKKILQALDSNRISLVTGSGRGSSQNITVLICFGNSSKYI